MNTAQPLRLYLLAIALELVGIVSYVDVLRACQEALTDEP